MNLVLVEVEKNIKSVVGYDYKNKNKIDFLKNNTKTLINKGVLI